MEAAESVLLPPSECNVTWQFALCLILPTLKQENPVPAKLVTTNHATETLKIQHRSATVSGPRAADCCTSRPEVGGGDKQKERVIEQRNT